MKILVLAKYNQQAQHATLYVRDQCHAYQQLGHAVEMVIPGVILKDRLSGYHGPVCTENLTTHFIPYLSFSTRGKYHVNVLSCYASIVRYFSSIIKSFQPDVIHAHTFEPEGAVACLLGRRFRLPVIITTHGSDTTREIARGNAKKILAICQKADAIVTVSSKLQRELLGLDPNLPICTIHNGFHYDFILPEQKRIPFSIISVGNLVKSKNFAVTLHAFALVIDRYPVARLHIVGAGPERDHLESLCQTLNISSYVTFYGQLPNHEVLTLMQTMEIFCLPSSPEGMGIVYLEAMAAGCIAIGTREEGIADIIHNGENGYMVDPSVHEVSSTIIQCLAHRDCHSALVESGRRTAAQYTWHRNAQQYVTLFSTVKGNTDRCIL